MRKNRFLVSGALMIAALKMMGCVYCNDCNEPVLTYRFINKTPYDVEITFVGRFEDTIAPSGSIAKLDSVEFVGKEAGFLKSHQLHSYPSSSALIEFDSAPKRCLAFSGPISDSTLDIRSRDAYDGGGMPFFYTIGESLFSKAGDCP